MKHSTSGERRVWYTVWDGKGTGYVESLYGMAEEKARQLGVETFTAHMSNGERVQIQVKKKAVEGTVYDNRGVAIRVKYPTK